MRRAWAGLGLSTRIAGVYAIGGLILAVTIALATLTLSRQNLLANREAQAFSVAVRNAQRVEGRLGPGTDIQEVQLIFDSLTINERSFPLLRVDNEWAASNPQAFGSDAVPISLRVQVENGNAARIRAKINGTPMLITGIPIPGVDASYFEAADASDLEETLNSLGFILIGVAAAAAIMSAGVGAWGSRRALTPLADVRSAAEALASGDLTARLDPPADADLASLAVSFNRMAQTLEERIEHDARFASEVSHELRSPLMTLNASIEVLNNNREALEGRSQTALDLLTDDVTRFTSLVEDLLEISRYDVGTASLHPEPIDVIEFVRKAAGQAPGTLAAVDPNGHDHLLINGDKRRLAQVLANLIDNANKYGSEPVTIGIDEADGIVTITVQDEGPGVAETERELIFQRFSRGSQGGRRGQGTGSGLGLALVAEHVRLHGGQVWAEDRTDGRSGSRFVVSLPIGTEAQDHEDLA
jgi:two-component system sensor histidine kinase MtrB